MSSRDSELLNAIKKLDGTVQTLTTAVNTMSSKYTTPANLADLIGGHANTRFKFYHIRYAAAPSWAGGEEYKSLTFDGTNWFAWEEQDGTIDTWSSTAITVFYTPVDSGGYVHVAWDWYNDDRLYVMGGTTIETVSSSGATLSTAATSHSNSLGDSNWSAGDWTAYGLAHDEVNDQLYALIYNSSESTYPLRIVSVNPLTGVMTDSSSVDDATYPPTTFNEMEIIAGKIFLLHLTIDVLIYEIGISSPFAIVDVPSYPRRNFCVDKSSKTWHFLDDEPEVGGSGRYASVNIRGLCYVDRVAVQSVANTAQPTERAVTVTNNTTEVLDEDPAREATLITNNSTSTIFFGDNSMNVNTGIPLLPYQTLELWGFTGDLYARVVSGTAEVRILEFR